MQRQAIVTELAVDTEFLREHLIHQRREFCMASATIWVSELGVPPREVCQDWTWQLRKHFESSRTTSETQLLPSLSWDDIEVSESGRLQFSVTADLYSIDELLDQLSAWTASPEEIEPHPSKPASFARASIKRSKVHSSNMLFDLFRQHRIASVMVVVIALTGVSGLLIMLNSTPAVKVVEKADLSRPRTEAARSMAVEKEQSDASGKPVSDEELSIANVPPPPTLDEVLGVQQSADGSDTIAGLNTLDLSGVIAVTTESNPSANSSIKTDSNQAAVTGPTASVSASDAPPSIAQSFVDTPAQEGDVMRDLAKLTEAAQANASESELAPDEKGSKTIFEPLVLRTSPMVQTHLLPSKLARPREPVWSITLALDDDFQVVPREPQRISDQQTATWIISNAEVQGSTAKSPVTAIVITAQVAPGRRAGLRWQIVVAASDLPNVMLPVGKEQLQLLQQRLQGYSESTRVQADRLKVIGSAAEKDMRAAISKQRASLESQSKLASRVVSVAAEAQLLDDLLRNQVTLYAELRDGEERDARLLLQFGDPENLKPEAEALESKPDR